MQDLIDRKAAIDILDAYQVMLENGEENPYSWARFRMSELPSAQPEITRCKDCEHWTNDDCPFAWGKVEDAFCSYAERRTDE